MTKIKPNPLISVILPVYNGEKYLEKAVSSILSQTYKNFELIIINDGSKDSSASIIAGFKDQRIRYVDNVDNIGLIATLNKGINIAEGDFIARMDSDDISYPNRFAEQIKCFELDDTLGVVGSSADIINENSEPRGLLKVPESHIDIKMGMLFTNQVIHPSVMLKKSVLTDFKDKVFDAKQLHVEDYALWVNLLDKTLFFNIQTPLIQYRIHGENISVVHSEQQSKTSLLLKNKISTSFGIHPNMQSLLKIQSDPKLKNTDREEVIEQLFNKLSSDFHHSWFISKLYWECNVKLKINRKGDLLDYLKSPYQKKTLWTLIYILTPIISKFPNSMFQKRMRIFQH